MLYYRAQDGITADIIPYYEDGFFYLFYLHDYRDTGNKGEGTPWRLIRTKDFVAYEEMGEVLPRGTEKEQDLYVFTGSVFKEAEGKYHIFYTGHNPHLRAQGYPEQAVMHAKSSDLIHWEKQKEDTFFAPLESYEPHDWRDPFVYLDEKSGGYKMLLAARTREGDKVKKGCTALCTSRDLRKWKVEEPLWRPEAFYAHECPDRFVMEGCEYLVYSEFSDRFATRYRVSEEGAGNWLSTVDDAFDGRAFYAAKTASDKERRYVFGWVPTRVDDSDNTNWQWGGNLMVHEVFCRQDKSLGCRLPESIRKHFGRQCYYQETVECGNSQGYAARSLITVDAESCLLTADVVISESCVDAGILLRHDPEEDFAYAYRISPGRGRLSFGKVPNFPWEQTNFTGLDRPVSLVPGKRYHLELVVEGDICVMYLDGTALTSRMHVKKKNRIGFFSENGQVRMENVGVFTI